MAKTQEQFESEIAAAKAKLHQENTVPTGWAGRPRDGGIQCDFDLPYSSLPKLNGSEWVRSEKLR